MFHVKNVLVKSNRCGKQASIAQRRHSSLNALKLISINKNV